MKIFDTIEENWQKIKESLRKEYELTDVSYNTWIVPLKVYDFDEENNFITILIPSDQNSYYEYISNKYTLPFKVSISEAINSTIDVKFILEKDLIKNNSHLMQKPENNLIFKNANINTKYTFDTFVVGNSNRFAHSAALAVAESPGEAYNPLFLYGGVGLGKTHLMHSIAHFILEKNKDAKVLYVTSEKFTNEVIEAIRIGNSSPTAMSKFRDKYRNIDVLLLDDVQFIIGKESTQEEFFHTFNQLYGEKKQIILSSDRPPKDMETLEDRLRSRFEWGLLADMQSPEYETRMAILQKKEELDGYNIPKEIIQYIATNVTSNIRELEGALNKIIAFSNLEKREIDIELAEEALKDIITPNKPTKITPQFIMDIVCDHFDISIEDIKSNKRKSEIVTPRQVIMYLCREYTDFTLNNIGILLGNRDHSTVLSGWEKISNKIKEDDSFNNTINIIIKKINPS